jgi:hypothetical protein
MAPPAEAKRLSAFERYLSAWVALCIVAGVALGTAAPGLVGALSRLEVRHVNLPIAVLIWLMIYPMMLRIDFAALRGVGRRPRGLLVVLFVNWLVKPFSMTLLGWLFFKSLFAAVIGPRTYLEEPGPVPPGALGRRHHGVRQRQRAVPRVPGPRHPAPLELRRSLQGRGERRAATPDVPPRPGRDRPDDRRLAHDRGARQHEGAGHAPHEAPDG